MTKCRVGSAWSKMGISESKDTSFGLELFCKMVKKEETKNWIELEKL